jgi:hypothetical protein
MQGYSTLPDSRMMGAGRQTHFWSAWNCWPSAKRADAASFPVAGVLVRFLTTILAPDEIGNPASRAQQSQAWSAFIAAQPFLHMQE